MPDRSTWDTPSVSPLLAEVAGAAPALVVTAGFDLLRADGDAYARKLADAGVAVEHRVYDDQVHGFFGMGMLADSLALSVEVARRHGAADAPPGAGPAGPRLTRRPRGGGAHRPVASAPAWPLQCRP